jgi:hypothetical protein
MMNRVRIINRRRKFNLDDKMSRVVMMIGRRRFNSMIWSVR